MGNEVQEKQDKFVTFELLGRTYRFKTEDDLEKANEVAELFIREVNKVRNELVGKQTRPSDQIILILAALNIADRQFELEKKYIELKNELSERSNHLIKQLDGFLE